MIKRNKNLLGKVYGKLTVIKLVDPYISPKGKKFARWICKCECGNTTITLTNSLTSGKRKSCGCLRLVNLKKAHKKIRTHGMAGTRFYKIWKRLKCRCDNKNISDYKHYGGRGIKYLWETFEQFKTDMYDSYLKHVKEFGEDDTTIDRIDNNGHYCKENCKWSTRKEQSNNIRRNRKININGEVKNLCEWCETFNISSKLVSQRIGTLKWPIEKALKTKPRKFTINN